MKLEDTIRYRLFRQTNSRYTCDNVDNFVIECKAERNRCIPICISTAVFTHLDLVYKQFFLVNEFCQERSTPRALYNVLFSNFSAHELIKAKIKDIVYYYACGVLFNEDKVPLFYFAYGLNTDIRDIETYNIPRLFINPLLFYNAAQPGRPMEKFFVSTILPFLIDNTVFVYGHEDKTVIEIDNNIDRTFFVPDNRLISSVPVDSVNDRLNDILANNADTIASFTDNYLNNV